MIVNPKLREFYAEIATSTVRYMNSPDEERKHYRRLLKVFKNLEEEEQVFIIKSMVDHVHYKNIATDPDMILQIHNIRVRTGIYIFIAAILLMLAASVIFGVNKGSSSIMGILEGVLKLLSI